ncbi:MAG: hypothetical protein L0Z62_14615, partial [Gemmataceae bacterium]|nr:hypothetical protein [Gemmataceae bacterium]
MQDWYTNNDFAAQRNLNIIAGDFVQNRGIVDLAIALNEQAVGPKLSADPANAARITCTTPSPTAISLTAYSLPTGPSAPIDVQYHGTSPGTLDLPQANYPDGRLSVRVVCDTADELTSALTLPVCVFPAGAFIMVANDPSIYVVSPSCQRRHIPDLDTLFQLKPDYGWVRPRTVAQSDFDLVPPGSDFPPFSNIFPFEDAMGETYGTPCRQGDQLGPGALIHLPGSDAIAVVSPVCLRRHIPNLTTLDAVNRYGGGNKGPVNLDHEQWNQMSALPDIPDSTTDPTGFLQAMRTIYGPYPALPPPVAVRPPGAECGGGAICHVELSRVHFKGPRVIA